MDILKRSIAPITSKAWEEIDETARDVLRTRLSARRFLSVTGPLGWDCGAIPKGRLNLVRGREKSAVQCGVHEVKPLLEARASFALDIWELDNIVRGARDADLDALEEAAREMALFEEQAVYRGFEPAGIEGLESVARKQEVAFSAEDSGSFIEALQQGLLQLEEAGIGGPYVLVINTGLLGSLLAGTPGYPLKQQIDDMVDGGIVSTPNVTSGLVVSRRGDDLELALGHDFSVGYESRDTRSVSLFLTESFTFHINEPRAAVLLTAGG